MSGAPMTRREVPPSVAAAASAVSARKKPTAEPPGALPVDKIRVGRRHRKDMGDVDALAQSIAEVGLLQPVVVRPDGALNIDPVPGASERKWSSRGHRWSPGISHTFCGDEVHGQSD